MTLGTTAILEVETLHTRVWKAWLQEGNGMEIILSFTNLN